MSTEKTDDPNESLYEGQKFSESLDIALQTIQMSQVEFSHMADSKANIMITVSSILLTLAIAKMEQGELVMPSIVLSIFLLPALWFAILCVMPSSTTGMKPIKDDEELKNINPMFFMHFTRMSLPRFERELEQVIRDPAKMYRHIGQDIYFAGVVLKLKKFRYLRWSYLSLMLGITAGLVTMLIDLSG